MINNIFIRIKKKIILIGTSGTGKTSFVNKYTKNTFSEVYKATIVSEFGFKVYEKDGKSYRIQLWDLAGQDKNAMVAKIFAKDSHGCIIFSDATNIQTREDTLKWRNSVVEAVKFSDGGKLPCIIAESKSDLIEDKENIENQEKEIKDFAEKNGFDGGFLVSSKLGENIKESIEYLLDIIIEKMDTLKKEDAFTTERKSIILEQNNSINLEEDNSINYIEDNFFISDLKLIIIGSEKTGKTMYLNKLIENNFKNEYKSTKISEYKNMIYEKDKTFYRIHFYDLSGRNRNKKTIKIFDKDAHGCIIISDSTNKQTRDDSFEYKKEIDNSCKFLDGKNIPCILVESKCDLLDEEDNDEEEIQNISIKNGFDGYFLTSAKTGKNIHESMEILINEIIKRMEIMKEQGNNVFTTRRKSVNCDKEYYSMYENRVPSQKYIPKGGYRALIFIFMRLKIMKVKMTIMRKVKKVI